MDVGFCTGPATPQTCVSLCNGSRVHNLLVGATGLPSTASERKIRDMQMHMRIALTVKRPKRTRRGNSPRGFGRFPRQSYTQLDPVSSRSEMPSRLGVVHAMISSCGSLAYQQIQSECKRSVYYMKDRKWKIRKSAL